MGVKPSRLPKRAAPRGGRSSALRVEPLAVALKPLAKLAVGSSPDDMFKVTDNLPAGMPVTREEIVLLHRTIGHQLSWMWSDDP